MDTLGRDDELRTIHTFLDRSAPGGMAALVLEGEAGIGKSTLWLAGVQAARGRGLRVLSSRPAEIESGVAHAALGDLLEDALADVLPQLSGPRRRALETALLIEDASDQPVDARTLAVAVRDALQLLTEPDPILVAIDDVQWLDASSANALVFAVRRLSEQNVRLLLARRLADGIPVSELELSLDDHRLERVHVAPFSPGALQAILQDRLGQAFARPTLLRLHEASGGNAFFALELARTLGTNVDLTQPLPVPETLEALVRARLDGLPDETRRALLLACTHGRLTPAQLDGDALEPAFADHVIELADGVIRFTHPLLASALYQAASPAARRRAHAQAAEIAGDPLARARQLALAAAGPDAETAAELEDAAAAATARGAAILAAELGEHAVRITPADAHADRLRRSISTARAHLAAGEKARPRAIALELVDSAEPGPPRAQALALLAELEKLDNATELLEEALREAEGDPLLEASLHRRLASTGRITRGRSWAELHARTAVELAEQQGDDALVAAATAMLAVIRFDLSDPDAPRLADRAYELAAACGDPAQKHAVTWALAHVLTWSVGTERARSLLEAYYRDWRDRDERMGTEALWYLAMVELSAGRWVLAAEYAERVHSVHEQYEVSAPMHFFPVALIAAHRGDLEQARELARRGRELAAEQGAFLGGLEAIVGIVDSWSGNAAPAEAAFAAAEERANLAEWREPNLRWWRADYAETLLKLGRTDDAVALLDAWEQDATRVGRMRVLAHVARCRGLVAAARGDVDGALSALAAAVAKHEAVDDAFGHARALLALGVVRRRARQKRPAREAIEAALVGFETLGAASWAENARAELGRIGGRTRSEGLTAAEQRVAALVAEGRTNREVAAALFLAERTVASHLSHVYAKLGVRSRTELARKLQTF
jgi:DNA-binding CsgD family transcriptional regulator